MLRAHDLGLWVDLAQKRLDLTALRFGHEVALVDEQQVGKLELVAEEVRDGALVALDLVPAAINERVHRVELLKDRRRVHDRHKIVKARHVVQARASGLVAKGKGLGHRHGLRDAR